MQIDEVSEEMLDIGHIDDEGIEDEADANLHGEPLVEQPEPGSMEEHELQEPQLKRHKSQSH